MWIAVDIACLLGHNGVHTKEADVARMVLYFPDDLDDRLRALADERGQSLSTLVTRLLQSALAKPKAKETAR